MTLDKDFMNTRDFQKYQRVFYKFSNKYPYEEKPSNISKKWGRGMVMGWADEFVVVKTDSCYGTRKKPWMLFKENELLTIREYYNLPDNER